MTNHDAQHTETFSLTYLFQFVTYLNSEFIQKGQRLVSFIHPSEKTLKPRKMRQVFLTRGSRSSTRVIDH